MKTNSQDLHRSDAEINHDLLAPLFCTGRKYYVAVAFFGSVALLAFVAWAYQIDKGIGVVGKNRPAFWGFYITSFVFWIGISHAGTLISAILRVVQAEWRRPITRCAEAITIFALFTGSLFPIIHLGRAWRFYWLIPYPNDRHLWPNFRSPLMWDFMAINTYLIGSLLYLYLPMIPDLALVRDKATGIRRSLYRILALGWRGTADEWLRLDKAISVMALLIIPVAISVHTIVSWDFAMTVQPMWHSTIFGPYFVVGAIFSGIAALLVAMVLVRKLLRLENYLQPVHFDNLAKLLLTMSLLWFYFTFTEYLTTWYGNEAAEMPVFWSKVSGPYAPLFWSMVCCNFLIPFPMLALKRLRTVSGIFISSVLVLIGMWLERFLIIVPTLVHPFLPYNEWRYRPSWVEVSIAAGAFGIFTLFYLLFAKLSPMISVWEVKEGQHTHKVA
ncbi:MAG TPA: NrfD/PsrC family molybdoenzyme membrane anchor subunit [Terriglobia bacterium]|nr:NrfD/PsrC family molybdoenzyme membrane anchor subunit [Terriglobia bacterium]